MSNGLELVIITGMSGAGKTVAIQSFEDLGYYCVDNMPPTLIPTFWELMKESKKIERVAVVMDLRSQEFFSELEDVINKMDNTPLVTTRILFLDAEDQSLISRYKETRRRHPLADNERPSIGIAKERELLAPLKSRARVIDTTHTSPRELRELIMKEFADETFEPFHVDLISFGFKFGAPMDADIMMDVRFLPNPYYIDSLRAKTGLDEEVYDYVMQQPETEEFYKKFMDLINYCLPGYKKEGKSSVVIAIGCTGGKHRSISLVRRIAQTLGNNGYLVNVTHRDQHRHKESVNRS